MQGKEKRRHHRFMALLEVHVLPGDKVPVDLKLTTVDVAVGGARCASNRPLEEGSRLQMTLVLVGGELRVPTRIELEAGVLRCQERPKAPEPRRYEVALEFTRIDPEDRKLLITYLNAL